jgi:hypothetical protein
MNPANFHDLILASLAGLKDAYTAGVFLCLGAVIATLAVRGVSNALITKARYM